MDGFFILGLQTRTFIKIILIIMIDFFSCKGHEIVLDPCVMKYTYYEDHKWVN